MSQLRSESQSAEPIAVEQGWTSPSLRDRAQAMRAAFHSAGDEQGRALIGEMIEHFRAWCLRHGFGDPFASMAIVRTGAPVIQQ